MTALRVTQRDLRLASGLTLFVYVATHLLNHALGLHSVAVAERGLRLAVAVWHSVPGTIALYGAAAVHVTLAFGAIYQRRTLRMPPLELLRIVVGLGMPLLLIGHAIATRIAWEAWGAAPEYSRVVWALWSADSEGRQLALLAPGWLHGCLGLHFAFSRRRWYRRLHYPLFAAAVLVPVLAGLGFLVMGKELALRTAEHAAFNAGIATPAATRAALASLRDNALYVYFALVAGVFALRELRALSEHGRKALVTIAYPGRSARVPRGWTVLEASRGFGIPHASMCGGRARCSTCRVQVTAGADACAPPGPDEVATLRRIHAGPGVRLACQLRPRGDIAVVPLLAAEAPPGPPDGSEAPVERDVALVAVVWRNRAEFARTHLAPDVVYVTRLAYDVVGSAVRAAGGIEADGASPGVLAVFGLADDLPQACRRALAAGGALDRALADLAARLWREFRASADFALCLHAGAAAVGSTGSDAARQPIVAGAAADAIGPMQAAAGERGWRIIVSAKLWREAGRADVSLPWEDVGGPPGAAALAAAGVPSLRAFERT